MKFDSADIVFALDALQPHISTDKERPVLGCVRVSLSRRGILMLEACDSFTYARIRVKPLPSGKTAAAAGLRKPAEILILGLDVIRVGKAAALDAPLNGLDVLVGPSLRLGSRSCLAVPETVGRWPAFESLRPSDDRPLGLRRGGGLCLSGNHLAKFGAWDSELYSLRFEFGGPEQPVLITAIPKGDVPPRVAGEFLLMPQKFIPEDVEDAMRKEWLS